MQLSKVKQELEKMSCSEHHEHPQVSIVGTQLKFKCCCEPFSKQVQERTKELVADVAKQEIESRIKRMFK